MKYITCHIIVLLTFLQSAFAQTDRAEIQRGNDQYRREEFAAAEATYNTVATRDPENIKAKYNQANAMYRQDKAAEALKLLDDITFRAQDNEIKAIAFYNKGAILSAQKKLEESIEAYKNALRINPSDKQARENLQKALLELKKKTPPKQQKDDQKKEDQKKQQQQPKMNPRDARQRLELLEQKEKDVQQRLQREKGRSGGGLEKDW